MPLTAKGQKILASMEKTYGSEAKEVFYASRNAGTITGVDSAKLDTVVARCDAFDHKAKK